MAGQALKAVEATFLDDLRKRYPDKLARLSDGFYDIKDKSGAQIPFRMNRDQADFIENRHGFDVILKARQRGFTTVIQLDMLDDCLFTPNLSAGVIAHNLKDAKAFFSDKIKFAYDNLPGPFRKQVAAEQDSAESLRFNNGSSIRVGTSLRSGTLQRLHVSEYGKLCAKAPERAQEVKSGAFNTVHTGQRIVVESTAEGRGGHFFEMVTLARKLAQSGAKLTALDFKFHFYPWWSDDGYVLDDEVIETSDMTEYFEKMEAQGVRLTRGQRAWYIKKEAQQTDDMKAEFPSTPDEAFEAAIEGAYFGPQMAKVRREGRICRVPVLDKPVYTSWDLGVGDDMTICFWQDVGPERRLIDYYENSGEGFAHYAQVLKDKGYNYEAHYMPHDADHRRLGVNVNSAKQNAELCGIKPVKVLKRIAEERDGIQHSRDLLPQVWIDETRCQRLIDCLDNYRREWDDKLSVFKDHPRHDEFSHGYKAFESAAIRPDALPPKVVSVSVPRMATAWNKRAG